MTPADAPQDDIARAGEYVLHLMASDERRAFAQRLAAEPALRAMVASWDEQLIPMAESFTPQQPPADLKSRIETVLFGQIVQPVWSFWRLLAGGLAAAAVALAVLVALPTRAPVFAPSLSAQIAAEDGSLVVLAQFGAQSGVLRVTRTAGAAPAGRVLELWLIAAGAEAPVSLGVLPADSQTDITLPAPVAATLAGGTLAISEEPVGGSPTGAPTGAVLALGAVTAL